MGDQTWTNFSTASQDAPNEVVFAPRFASRPRRQYRPRGLPLEQIPNLHLFPATQQAPYAKDKPQFPAARQIPVPDRRTGVAWAAVCIAALTTGGAVYVLMPGIANQRTALSELSGNVTLRAPLVPISTSIASAGRNAEQSPLVVSGRLERPSPRGTRPRLKLSTPTVQLSLGKFLMPNQDFQRIASPNLPIAANTTVAPGSPQLPTPAALATPFTCMECRADSPDMQQFTVAIFTSTAKSEAATQRLRRLGVTNFSTNAAPIGVRQNQVRFYNAADAFVAKSLARQFDANLVDLTWYGAAPASATLELWLTTTEDPA